MLVAVVVVFLLLLLLFSCSCCCYCCYCCYCCCFLVALSIAVVAVSVLVDVRLLLLLLLFLSLFFSYPSYPSSGLAIFSSFFLLPNVSSTNFVCCCYLYCFAHPFRFSLRPLIFSDYPSSLILLLALAFALNVLLPTSTDVFMCAVTLFTLFCCTAMSCLFIDVVSDRCCLLEHCIPTIN